VFSCRMSALVKSRHLRCNSLCPLRANSGHRLVLSPNERGQAALVHIAAADAQRYLARRSFGPKGYVAIGNVAVGIVMKTLVLPNHSLR
jgi:hypothetical protein